MEIWYSAATVAFFDLRIRRDLWARAQGFHPKTAPKVKESHDPHASNTCFVYVCAIMEKIYERFKISQLNFQVQVFQAFPSFLDYTFLLDSFGIVSKLS